MTSTDTLRLRHDLRAAAYVEAKRLVPLLKFMGHTSSPRPHAAAVKKLPIHYHMHLLPGFNTHFVPSHFRGWMRLRMFDVRDDPRDEGYVRVELNKAFSWGERISRKG